MVIQEIVDSVVDHMLDLFLFVDHGGGRVEHLHGIDPIELLLESSRVVGL